MFPEDQHGYLAYGIGSRRRDSRHGNDIGSYRPENSAWNPSRGRPVTQPQPLNPTTPFRLGQQSIKSGSASIISKATMRLNTLATLGFGLMGDVSALMVGVMAGSKVLEQWPAKSKTPGIVSKIERQKSGKVP